MKTAALLIVVFCLQAHAEIHDILSCQTFTDDSIQALRVYETESGYGLIADVKRVAFSHAKPYHSESAVNREFVNGRGALHFENENELLVHGFGAIEYNTRDQDHLLYFRDHECTLTPGTATVAGTAQLSRTIKNCDLSGVGLLVQEAKAAAEAGAASRCQKFKPVRISDFDVETQCKSTAAEVTVSAVFRCVGLPEESSG